MDPKLARKLGMTVLGWCVALIFFFPVLWMLVTSFKTEIDAISNPSLIFRPRSRTTSPSRSARTISALRGTRS